MPPIRLKTGHEEHDNPLVDIIQSRAGWFATLGILEGRDVEPPRAGSPRELIVDRRFAAYFFPDGRAVGHPVVVAKDTLPIVGVVDHARQYDLHRDGRPQIYLRDQDDTYGALYFALRTTRRLRISSLTCAACSSAYRRSILVRCWPRQ